MLISSSCRSNMATARSHVQCGTPWKYGGWTSEDIRPGFVGGQRVEQDIRRHALVSESYTARACIKIRLPTLYRAFGVCRAPFYGTQGGFNNMLSRITTN